MVFPCPDTIGFGYRAVQSRIPRKGKEELSVKRTCGLLLLTSALALGLVSCGSGNTNSNGYSDNGSLIQDAGGTLNGAANGARDAMDDAGAAVRDGMDSAGNAIRNGVDNARDAVNGTNR